MSKPVRLPDYLHAEVERLAEAEKRSTANMVQVLLEQALKMEGPVTEPTPGGKNVTVERPAVLEPGVKKRMHPCRHHVPPSRRCDYCDV